MGLWMRRSSTGIVSALTVVGDKAVDGCLVVGAWVKDGNDTTLLVTPDTARAVAHEMLAWADRHDTP